MHGAQERKFAARAGPSIARSGLHTVNKLLTVLFLRAPMCRASVGPAKTRPCGPPTVKRGLCRVTYAMFNRPVCDVTSCVGAWSNYYF